MQNTIILSLLLVVSATTILSIMGYQTVNATGGGEVIELVIPMIDEATQSIQNNDTQKALSQLDEIKTELKDTFFAEEEEEEED